MTIVSVSVAVVVDRVVPTRKAGSNVSDGRPRGTTREAGSHVNSGRPCGTTSEAGKKKYTLSRKKKRFK